MSSQPPLSNWVGEGVGHYPSPKVNCLFQEWKLFVDIQEFEREAQSRGLSPDVNFYETWTEVENEHTGQITNVGVVTMNPAVSGVGPRTDPTQE